VRLPEWRNLGELGAFVRSMPCGGSTNFYKVFQLLRSATPPPKRVFVFSDMQFNCAGGRETDFRRAREEYAALGLPMPQLVFWNLNSQIGAPALAGDEEVALVSGFSAVMLKSLMRDGNMNPLSTLCKSIDTPLLRKPRVIYNTAEALEWFQIPSHAPTTFREEHGQSVGQPACSSEGADSSQQKESRQHGRPFELASLTVGRLPNKEAIAAFMGKKGESVRALRLEMRNQVRLCLDKKARRRFDFWLDVQTTSVTAPALETGDIKVIARARFPRLDLLSALQTLQGQASKAIHDAEQRAARPKPQRREKISTEVLLAREIEEWEIAQWESREEKRWNFDAKRLDNTRRLRRRWSISSCRGSNHAGPWAASRRSLKQQEHRQFVALKRRMAKRERNIMNIRMNAEW